MSENKLREIFLGKLIAERSSVTVFLINGVKLQGTIDSFDTEGVVLEHKGHRQFVFQHAISTIMPVINNIAATS